MKTTKTLAQELIKIAKNESSADSERMTIAALKEFASDVVYRCVSDCVSNAALVYYIDPPSLYRHRVIDAVRKTHIT